MSQNTNNSDHHNKTSSSARDLLDDAQVQEWEKLQNELAKKVSINDVLCNFDPSELLGVDDYFKNSNISFPSLNGNDDDDESSGKSKKFPPLRWVGGLDISFVKDTPIAVASLVVVDVSTASKEDNTSAASATSKNNNKKIHHNNKDQNPFTVVYEDMLHCRMDVPYVPGYLAFREVDPLRQLLKRIREKAPQFFPQVFFLDGNGLLHYRKCGLAVHLAALEDVPLVGCAKKILAVDGLGREITEKMIIDGTKDPSLIPGTFTYRNTTLVPLRGPKSGFMYGFGALTGNSTSKPIYISPGHRLSHQLAAMLAVRLAPFRVVEPIRQADLRSRRYIEQNFADLLSGKKEQPEQQQQTSNQGAASVSAASAAAPALASLPETTAVRKDKQQQSEQQKSTKATMSYADMIAKK